MLKGMVLAFVAVGFVYPLVAACQRREIREDEYAKGCFFLTWVPFVVWALFALVFGGEAFQATSWLVGSALGVPVAWLFGTRIVSK